MPASLPVGGGRLLARRRREAAQPLGCEPLGWRRLADGSRAGYAELEHAGETVMRHGTLCTLLPDEIHSVHNEGETTSLSLHIYGQSLNRVARNEFVPEENIVRPCPQRKRMG